MVVMVSPRPPLSHLHAPDRRIPRICMILWRRGASCASAGKSPKPYTPPLIPAAAGMPKALQAEALLLLPSILLLPSQHAQAAGLLVRSLGFPHPPPPALRLPLLHALNLLDVSGPSAGDVAGLLEQVRRCIPACGSPKPVSGTGRLCGWRL